MEEGFNPIINNFSNDVILSITKPNGSKILEGGGIYTFENKAKVGRVDLCIHYTMREGVDIKVQKGEGKGIPVFLVHEMRHSIRPKGLKGLKKEENSMDFS